MQNFYLETNNTVYVFEEEVGILDRWNLKIKFGKKIILLKKEDFREMKRLLRNEIIQGGVIKVVEQEQLIFV